MRCQICLLNHYDFVCYDCHRVVCGDCSQNVLFIEDGKTERNIRVCTECIEGITDKMLELI